MSEPIWCTIRVKTPASWMPEDPPTPTHYGQEGEGLPMWAGGLSEALCNGSTDWTRADDTIVWDFSGEGNYGLADDDVEFWLDWLGAHHVPFYASDDSKYEFQGSWRLFDGEKIVAQGAIGTDDLVLDRHDWAAIKSGKSWAKTVDDYFDPPKLDDLSIAHLPAAPPHDEEVPA